MPNQNHQLTPPLNVQPPTAKPQSDTFLATTRAFRGSSTHKRPSIITDQRPFFIATVSMSTNMSPRGLPHVAAFEQKHALFLPYHHRNAVFLLWSIRLSPFTSDQRKNRPHMIASIVDEKAPRMSPFRVPRPAKAALRCQTHRQKGPKNRFLTAIRV